MILFGDVGTDTDVMVSEMVYGCGCFGGKNGIDAPNFIANFPRSFKNIVCTHKSLLKEK
jgi:hypothetical protein